MEPNPKFDLAHYDATSYAEMVRKLAKAPADLQMGRTPAKQRMINQAQRFAKSAEALQECLDEIWEHHSIHGTMDAIRQGLWLHWEHMVFALAGEAAGEFRDMVKRHVIYGKDLDDASKGPSLRANAEEEAGDCTFFIEGARQFCSHPDFAYFWETVQDAESMQGRALELLLTCEQELEELLNKVSPEYSIEAAMRDNKLKLIGPTGRYCGVVYSDEAAIARADKAT